MEPIFFAAPERFRSWLAANHATAAEVLVGFHKEGSGRPSMTWPESVDEALCYGWIDGVRRGLDEESYTIRFTPRKTRSKWSAVNLRRVPELIADERMQPAGLAAYERRTEAGYSYERNAAELSGEQEARFRANPEAWEFWQAQPPGYRKLNTFRVVSAKRAETQPKRLDALIEASAHGERLA
jgi:uncharacterized protein YdeI (YjbR/CyaY-like superfamily)